RVGADISNVDGQDAPRIFGNDLAVDLGIMLAGVADEDERKRRVKIEDLANERLFVTSETLGPERRKSDVPVTERDWAVGNALHLEKLGDDVVNVPGAARDVEDRVETLAVAPALEGLIKRGDAGK